MSHIKSRKHAVAPRRSATLPVTTFAAGLALAAATPAFAQSTAPQDDPPARGQDAGKQDRRDHKAGSTTDNGNTLGRVEVRGSWFSPSSPKFTASLLDTPKSVSIIPRKLLEETGVTNLQDALRMVPGITFGAGEGGNPTGDRPFIRGFDAQSNTFIDGLRDAGSQTREIFDLEQVEVVKGPSSAYGGRDSGGGSLNLVSKTPRLKSETRVSLGAGTDDYFRGTLDSNIVLGDGIAARLNVMKHQSDIPGRDAANVSRWGIAPSIGFGLNGDTQLILSHYHLETDDLPDAGGFPYSNVLSGANAVLNGDGSPLVPDRRNYYGLKDRDFQRTRADITTIDASHVFGEHKLRNIFRVGNTRNDYLWTQPDDSNGNPLLYGTLWRRSNTRASETRSYIDQLSLTGRFRTGAFTHSYSAGLEYSDERTERGSYLITPGTSNFLTGTRACPTSGAATGYNCTDFYHPNPDDPWAIGQRVTRSPNALDVVQNTLTKSAYAFDTIELSPRWLVNLGLRYDNYSTVQTTPSATAPTVVLANKASFVNSQVGLVFKPAANGSIYLSYGSSSTPPGMDGGDGADGISATIQNLKPQDTTNVELGTKWDLFGNRLNLTAAVFHTVMDNARITVENGTTQNAGRKKVDGVEIGFTGKLTRRWSVFGGYTHLNAIVADNGYVCAIAGRTCPSGIYNPSPYNGNVFPNTARDSASVWTSYVFPFGLNIGVGAAYVAKQYGDVANTRWIPAYTRWDAVAGYAFGRHYSLQLNLQNLTDKTYFARAYAAHYAGIAPGRSATLTFNVRF